MSASWLTEMDKPLKNRLWDEIWEVAIAPGERLLSHITLLEVLARYKNSSILERARLAASCEIWISGELEYAYTDWERMVRAIYVLEFLEAAGVERLLYYKKMALRNLDGDPEPIYD